MAATKARKPGPGRTRGVPNKITRDVKEAARIHGPGAIAKLAHLMEHADSDGAKISAIKEILDRAYGRPAQSHTGENGEGPVQHLLNVNWMTEAEAKRRGWA